MWAILWKIHHAHYFFGFNPKIFEITIYGTRLSFGIYIPIIGLAKIYKIEGSERTRVDLAWQFFDHPVWKRSLVALGGTISLILMGIACSIFTTFLEKEYYISKDTANKYGFAPSETAMQYGFKNGDQIIKINGNDYESISELTEVNKRTTYTVVRLNDTLNISIEPDVIQSSYEPFLNLITPPVIMEVDPSSSADKAGLKKGDHLIEINDHKVFSTNDLHEIRTNVESDTMRLLIRRDSSLISKTLFLPANEAMGIFFMTPEFTTYENTFGESIIKGTQQAFRLIDLNIKAFTGLLGGKVVSRRHSGPIGVAQAYGGFQWLRFWRITGLLAMVTAFFNLLPLPRAAFWQSIPLAYEAITKERFKLSTYNNLIRASYFMVILLMIWIVIGDISKVM
ncbi:RIP metalloprotease RseP [Fulvivirga kasyanovii]